MATRPFIPVPEVWKIDFFQELFDQRVSNTLHVLDPGSLPTDTDRAVYVTSRAIRAWVDNMLAEQSREISLRRVRVRHLGEQSGADLETEVPGGANGNQTIDSLPGNVAFAVSLRTGLSGRSRRGRIYISGLPENGVTGNTLTGPYRGGLTAAVRGLIDDLVADELLPVIVSYVTGGEYRPVGLVNRILSVVSTDGVVDSQRRRLTGRGI